MLRNHWMSIVLTTLGLAAVGSAAFAADASEIVDANAGSEACIKAFNEHDAAALGALFTESADFAFL